MKTPDDIPQLLIGAHLGIKIAFDNRSHQRAPGLLPKIALPHLQRIIDGVIIVGDLPGKPYLFTRIEHRNHFLVSLLFRQRLAVDFFQNHIKTLTRLLGIPIPVDHTADKNFLIKFRGVILDIVQSHRLECGGQLVFRVLLDDPKLPVVITCSRIRLSQLTVLHTSNDGLLEILKFFFINTNLLQIFGNQLEKICRPLRITAHRQRHPAFFNSQTVRKTGQ